MFHRRCRRMLDNFFCILQYLWRLVEILGFSPIIMTSDLGCSIATLYAYKFFLFFKLWQPCYYSKTEFKFRSCLKELCGMS